ncbi:MAG: hypothetical protein OCC46_03545 [Pseudodesulfovibrio sp.]
MANDTKKQEDSSRIIRKIIKDSPGTERIQESVYQPEKNDSPPPPPPKKNK